MKNLPSDGCMIRFHRFDKKETIRTEVERKMPIIMGVIGESSCLTCQTIERGFYYQPF